MRIPPLNFGRSQRLPLILQSESAECGLACLAMIAAYHGHAIDLLSMRQRFSISLRGVTLKNIVDMGAALKLQPRPLKLELEELPQMRTPCILHWEMAHFVVLKSVQANADGSLRSAMIHDPARGLVRVTAAEMSASFTGVALELTPAADFEAREEKRKISIGAMLSSVTGLRGALTQVFALAVALEIFALGAPLFMQLVIDGPVASSDRNMLTVVALGFVLLLLVQTSISVFRSWSVLYISTHLKLQWVANVFSHLLHLPLAFFEKRHMGDVTSRFQSVHTIQETLSGKFIEAVLDGILACTALAVLLMYSAQLAIIAIAAVLVYFSLRWVLFLSLRRANEDQLVQRAKEQSIFFESVRGIQAIKLFNHEAERQTRWMNAMAASTNHTIVTQKLNLGFATATTLLMGIENIAVVWFGARLVIDGSFSIGMLYAFLAYKTIFATRAFALVDKVQEFRMLSLQAERLADIVLTPREPDDEVAPPPSQKEEGLTIELRNVSFRYSDADPWVLRNLSMTINAGQSLAVTGHSGCGKTTLIKMLIGILPPTEGEILVDGVPLQRFGVRAYRSTIGAVMQDDQLFAGSITDNICFFDQGVDMARVHSCAAAASLAGDIASMPMGYQTLVGEMGTSLSGGQKQRLLLARALYKGPRILFLDEATSNLDSANEQRVNEAINRLDVTRIIVAHRQETIASAERVLELANGVIVRDFLQETEVVAKQA